MIMRVWLMVATITVVGSRVTYSCDFASQYAWGNVIVSDVDFRSAPLSNAVSFLNEVIAHSVTNIPPLTIQLAPSALAPSGPDSIFSSAATNTLGSFRVTFHARHIRMGCLLRTIANVAGLVCDVNESGATFRVAADIKPQRGDQDHSSLGGEGSGGGGE